MRLEERRSGETARDYARRMIRDNIVSMELRPGAMVSENELAAQMGLSRTPVREALMDLSAYHIVDILPQRGSRIALIDFALVEEARFARQVLECAIVAQVAGMATAADIAALRENVREQMMLTAKPPMDSARMMELDDAFHETLFAVAQKRNLYRMLAGMTVHFDRVRTLALTVVKENKIVGDHGEIVEAIAARDTQRASELMERHLTRVKLDEQTIRSACPQYVKGADRA